MITLKKRDNDGSYYIKIILCSKELKLNHESNNLPEKCSFIKHVGGTGNIYIKIENGDLADEVKRELEHVGILLFVGNTGYIRCPQILFDYLHQAPLNDLIDRKKNGDYYILGSFLKEKCYHFLKDSPFSFYTFYAIVKFIGLCLFLVVIWIAIFMLQVDSNFGKVVVAIFLTYIPKTLDLFTRPWYTDVSKINMEDYVNEAMKEELKKRQNALTLRYILIALQFYCKDTDIARVIEGENNQ